MSNKRATSGHEERIERVLRGAYHRMLCNGEQPSWEGLDAQSPLDALIEKEEGPLGEEVMAAKMETMSLLLDYCFGDGPHPGAVLRRLFALAWGLRKDLVADMSQSEISEMFGETRAAMSFRVKRIFEGYQARAGMRGCCLPGQKPMGARASYAEAQKGNTNRRSGR